MIMLPRRVSAQRAADTLHRVFDRMPADFAFRLWDGTLVPLGTGAPICTIVVPRPETFVRLVRDPSPLNFAEAYVEGAIDVEGDLFAGMKVADAMENLRLSVGDRLRLFVDLWRN